MRTIRSEQATILAMLTLLIACFTPAGQLAAQELDLAEFERLHKQLEPKKQIWKTIPWHTDLLTAQKAAVEQKKLIFIWAMDGHPLGCT